MGRRPSNPLVLCPRCVPPTAIIAGDYKPISQLQPGDRCLGLTGKVEILDKFRRHYDGRMVRIKAWTLLPIELTPEHPVLVCSGFHPKSKRAASLTEPYWKRAEDVKPKKRLRDGDYLLIPKVEGFIDISELDLSTFTTDHGLNVARAKKVPVQIPLNGETAWLLGMYVAEGCCTPKEVVFCLGKHEEEIGEKIQRIARKLGYSPYVTELRTARQVGIPSRMLSRAFSEWCGRGAGNKRIPEFILYHKDEKILRAFLSGEIEGDGYFNKSKRLFEVITVSKVLALQLQLLSLRLGLLASIQEKHLGQGEIEGRRVNQKTQYCIHIYKPQHYIVRARVFKDYYLAPVRSVEFFHYKGDVMNIETSDGTYLVSNAVVHNCNRPGRLYVQFRNVGGRRLTLFFVVHEDGARHGVTRLLRKRRVVLRSGDVGRVVYIKPSRLYTLEHNALKVLDYLSRKGVLNQFMRMQMGV